MRFVEQLGTPNSVKKGDVICFKYKHEKWLENKFATRYENVNPFHVVNWIGAIEMNPATDTWIDTKKTKKTIDQEGNYESTIQELGIDTNTDFLQSNGVHGKLLGLVRRLSVKRTWVLLKLIQEGWYIYT